jgi:tagatose-1,6-bisphosphate aldolase
VNEYKSYKVNPVPDLIELTTSILVSEVNEILMGGGVKGGRKKSNTSGTLCGLPTWWKCVQQKKAILYQVAEGNKNNAGSWKQRGKSARRMRAISRTIVVEVRITKSFKS